MHRANTASATCGMATPRSSPACEVHLPVPFWPAVSRITSTIGLPVSGSLTARMSVVISIRYESSTPLFHLAKTSCISAALMPRPADMMW